jgi:hypothetical protein
MRRTSNDAAIDAWTIIEAPDKIFDVVLGSHPETVTLGNTDHYRYLHGRPPFAPPPR